MMLGLVSFALLSSGLAAQTIVGTWQGSLPIAQYPRIVVKIGETNEGALRGAFYRIDHDGSSIPLSSVVFVAPDLALASNLADTAFRGRMGADGRTIVGTWTQNKQAYPLTLSLATSETLWHYAGAAVLPLMDVTADPAFEVATIKPSLPDAKGWSYNLRSRQFSAKNRTVADLIQLAYKVRSRQISGGPAWMLEAKFDIAGEPDADGLPSRDQYLVMIQKLLADRFHLRIHTVEQTFPVYSLTWQKSAMKGTKITVADPGMSEHGSIYPKDLGDGQTSLLFSAMTMTEFTNILMNFIEDRQILDETGLTGMFDFTMIVPSSVFQNADADEKANAFLRAVQPLGFQLTPKKAPLDVLVIDRLEKPTEN